MINELKRPDVREFILAHENDDPTALVLQASRYSDLPIKAIAWQILCRVKAKTKLPKFYQHPDIIYPQGVSLEQSSSEATAIYKASQVEGNTLTDLTGGFGIDSFYFSKSSKKVNYVEKEEELVQLVKNNFESIGANNVFIYHNTAEEYLANEKQPTDIYYLDPARRDAADKKVFQVADCQPNLELILPLLIVKNSQILIKMSPLLDIQDVLNKITEITSVYVVAVKNECKEILFKIDPHATKPVLYTAVNINIDQVDKFEFTIENEKVNPTFSLPLNYIYEPNVAILKAGGFNSVSHQLGLKKLHRNSHLYTSTEQIKDFPGRVFALQAQSVLSKKKLKPLLTEWKANITVRNYPMTVAQIRQKLDIKEGGGKYIFATTTMDGKPVALICQKAKEV